MASRRLSTPARRVKMREALWPGSGARVFPREGAVEKGWFSAPRTLPLVLMLLGDDERLSSNMDLTRTYVGLLADNFGEGLVEIGDENHYALTAGLKGARGVRSWRERVKRLHDLGFIQVEYGIGGRIGFVLIVHPDTAVQALRERGLVPDDWWADYTALWLNVQGAPVANPVGAAGSRPSA